MDSPLPILYEDNHLLVVNKPAGIATQGALAGEASVHGVMSEYLKQRFNKPGNVYLGIVSRLDAVTSGVVVLARTSKAAARLSEQFRDRSVVKQYVAVLAQNVAAKATTGKARAGGQFGSDWQLWQDWLLKDDAAAKMRTVREGTPGAQLARLQCLQLAAHESDLCWRNLHWKRVVNIKSAYKPPIVDGPFSEIANTADATGPVQGLLYMPLH